MFEVREDTTAVSTYVDGASGIGYAWTGTANESTSIKKRGMTTIKGMKIVNESSTGAEIVYVAIGTTATSSTGIPVGRLHISSIGFRHTYNQRRNLGGLNDNN